MLFRLIIILLGVLVIKIVFESLIPTDFPQKLRMVHSPVKWSTAFGDSLYRREYKKLLTYQGNRP